MTVKDIVLVVRGSSKLELEDRFNVCIKAWGYLREIETKLMHEVWTAAFNRNELKNVREFVPVLEDKIKQLKIARKKARPNHRSWHD